MLGVGTMSEAIDDAESCVRAANPVTSLISTEVTSLKGLGGRRYLHKLDFRHVTRVPDPARDTISN